MLVITDGNSLDFQPSFPGHLNFDSSNKDYSNSFVHSEKVTIADLQYHGTTTVAFKNGDNVIVCVDSKASIGKYVGSRTVKKVFPISPYIVATMAGGAGDCAYWIRNIAAFVKTVEYEYEIPAIKVSSIAKVLANKLAEFKGAGLSVGTMIAGFDISSKQPSCTKLYVILSYEMIYPPKVYYVDSEGSYVSGDLFCVGSGATLAYSVLDSAVAAPASESEKASNDRNRASALRCLSLDRAVEVAVEAVQVAAHRDGYSGGYINVLVINESGIRHLRRMQAKKFDQIESSYLQDKAS